MARTFGKVKATVWVDRDFRGLSAPAQWLYFALLSQPQITNLGILQYVPEKWARLAQGLTSTEVERAVAELEAADYVIVDRESFELLIRSFIFHDDVWKQPTLVTNARTLLATVESDAIRALLVERHPWLADGSLSDAEIRELEKSRHTPTGEASSEGSPEDSRATAGKGKGPGAGVSLLREGDLGLTEARPPAGGTGSPERPSDRTHEDPTIREAIRTSLGGVA